MTDTGKKKEPNTNRDKAETGETENAAPRDSSSDDLLNVSGARLYGKSGLRPAMGKPLSAKTPMNWGQAKAPGMKGQPGTQGQPGMKGHAGMQGRPGMKGQPGMQSQPGMKGGPGMKGQPGMQGQPAVQGQPMSQGQPGPQVNMQEINYMFGQAQQALQQGQRPAAENTCRQILQLVPSHLGALRMLTALRRDAGDQQAVGSLISQALRAYPHNDQVLVDAAQFLENTGRVGRAEQNYSRAARINPRNFDAQVGLARMAQRHGNSVAAEHHYRQAYYLQPRAAFVAASLAQVLSHLNRFEESERFYRIAVSLNPKDAGTLINWAKMEEGRNDVDRANQLLEMAREIQPDFPLIGMTEAQIARRNKDFGAAVKSLDTIEVDRLRPGMQAAYWYERGNTLDKAKQYDDAFAAYDKANEINREKLGIRYRADHVEDLADRIKTFFTREMADKLPRAKAREESGIFPIFICGFTRSGTSLVEQILGSHPDIAPGDELFYIAEIAQNAPQMVQSRQRYPECLEELTQPDKQHLVQRFRDEYLSRVRMTAILEPGARRFTDKMPMNEFHLGLIHLAFPDTHIIHMARHPLDTVLASYFIDARHGQFCTYDLETAAKHYVILSDLTKHYLQCFPEIKYARVRYEDVVADNKKETQKMLEFLEEPWDDTVLEYYNTKRTPRTPSYADVKQKIYTDSTYRYKNYREHVDQILPILAPYIEELGYTVD